VPSLSDIATTEPILSARKNVFATPLPVQLGGVAFVQSTMAMRSSAAGPGI